MHVTPLPLYPALQLHTKDPFVFLHSALMLQLLLASSEQKSKYLEVIVDASARSPVSFTMSPRLLMASIIDNVRLASLAETATNALLSISAMTLPWRNEMEDISKRIIGELSIICVNKVLVTFSKLEYTTDDWSESSAFQVVLNLRLIFNTLSSESLHVNPFPT
jgi:hypothetical protein